MLYEMASSKSLFAVKNAKSPQSASTATMTIIQNLWRLGGYALDVIQHGIEKTVKG